MPQHHLADYTIKQVGAVHDKPGLSFQFHQGAMVLERRCKQRRPTTSLEKLTLLIAANCGMRKCSNIVSKSLAALIDLRKS